MRIDSVDSEGRRLSMIQEDFKDLARLGIDTSQLSSATHSGQKRTDAPMSSWERAVHASSPFLNFTNGVVGILAFLSFRVSNIADSIKEEGINKLYPELNSSITFVAAILILTTLVTFIFVCIERLDGLDTSHIEDLSVMDDNIMKIKETLLSFVISLAGLGILFILLSR